MRLTSLYIACALFFLITFTGCLSIRLRTANENYQQFAYAEAIKDYEWVLQKKNIPEAVPLLAESYRLTGNDAKAEYWYKVALKNPNPDLKWKLYVAEALQKQGKCAEAKTYFNDYIALNRNDYKAQRLMASCDSMQQFYLDTTLFSIQPLKLNSMGENNFSPAFYRSGIVFLSDRNYKGLSRSKSEWTGKRYLDLFYAQKTDKNNWIDPEPLRGDVNGRFNEGPAVFTHDFSSLYFTRNNYLSSKVEKNKKNVNVLKIYEAKQADGEWKITGPLSFNSEEYSVCHPAINSDGTVMYFSSDIPWGYGGMDIYMVRRTGGDSWSKPVNLGAKVNSEGNEVFPFMQNDTLIYFSSDGHYGIGGLDVFSAQLINNEWQNVENVGAPVNSSADDFGFIIDSSAQTGYFSSNRINGVDKIFTFHRNQPHLSATLQFSGIDNSNAIETLITIYKNGKRDSTITVRNSKDVNFRLAHNTEYNFEIDNKDYYSKKIALSTAGRKLSENILVPVHLEKIQLNVPVIWHGVDFNKKEWQLKLQSADSLETLVQLLQQNPGIQIEVGSYTDSRGSDADNLKLTQKRAELVVQYLTTRGIKADRLTAKGYGESKLLNKCVNGILCIEEDHQVNNRIEITVRNIIPQNRLQ
jgi:flagellar motor protein MotB